MANFWHWLIIQDQSFFLAANHFLNQIPGSEYILGWPTILGQPRFALPLAAIFLFFGDRPRWWRVFLIVSAAYVISGGASELLKDLIQRDRPFETFSSVCTHFKLPTTKAFPSGHVVVVTCVIFVLNQIYSNKLVWCYLLVFWMAITRIYVGVHYPLDVIAGFFVGLTGSWISLRLFRRSVIGAEHDKRK
ncbi:MAG: phosphatase PAP2 family protein [Candidatus Omnitrophica bacterium]|nr:phosphatase PAP2 family protein [Candidatus Omnitrophota bacterium]